MAIDATESLIKESVSVGDTVSVAAGKRCLAVTASLVASNDGGPCNNSETLYSGLETPCSSSKIPCHGAETPHNGVKTPRSTAETPCSGAKTSCDSAEPPCNSAKTTCSSAEMMCNSAEIPCSSPEKACNDAETPCSSAERQCNGAETSKSGAETTCNSAEIPYNSDKTACSTSSPCDSAATPSNNDETPCTDVETPCNSTGMPSSSTPAPPNDGETPCNSTGMPSSSIPAPPNDGETPCNSTGMPSSSTPAPPNDGETLCNNSGMPTSSTPAPSNDVETPCDSDAVNIFDDNSESRPCTNNEDELRLRYTFDIENFECCREVQLESAPFSKKGDSRPQWRIRVNPKGVDRESEEFVSVFLVLDSLAESRVWARFKFALLDDEDHHVEIAESRRLYKFSEGDDWGFPAYIRRESLLDENLSEHFLPSGRLRIFCEVEDREQLSESRFDSCGGGRPALKDGNSGAMIIAYKDLALQ